MALTVVPLDNSYKGRKISFDYESDGYYDVALEETPDGFTFSLIRKQLPTPVEKSFTDTLLEDWLEDPQLFGAVEDGTLVGIVELSHEKWDNRMRISNIWVDRAHRRRGVGSLLMDKALRAAEEANARALVLETQSCNIHAIDFYRKHGFSFIGLDVAAYSNQDIEKREVRLEMGRKV